MRLIVVDKPCKTHICVANEYGIDIECILDYSIYKFDEEAMQLPLEHFVEQITNYEYSLRPGGQVHLIGGSAPRPPYDNNGGGSCSGVGSCKGSIKKDEIVDIYFLANDDIDPQILNDDIIAFLEILGVLPGAI